MYAEFYKLTALPFLLTPDSRFFFKSRVHAQAMAHLTYGLGQGEGFIIIVGDIGAGKTTLVQRLCATINTHDIVAARIVTTRLGVQDLLAMVAHAFGLTVERSSKAAVLKTLEAFLRRTFEAGRRALLIVDEAQNLSPLALEELRMLSNFQIGERSLFQTFLLGQPQFQQILARPGLEQLRQRVIASYFLGPMDREETGAYILHRLGMVGWQGDPEFTEAAIDAVFTATGGLPRRINTLCSRIMLYGFLTESHRFTADDVGRVIDDLDRETEGLTLPEPASTGTALAVRMPTRVAAIAERVEQRLTGLEERVDQHERTIRRAMTMAIEFLDRDRGAA